MMSRLKERLRVHEGYSLARYDDTEGTPTIGVGFNLRRADAARILASVGAPPLDAVLHGQPLTDDQVDKILDLCVRQAEGEAETLVSDWSEHPEVIREVLIELVFNMGMEKVRKFVNFLRAVEERDYIAASVHLRDSRWYKQVKTRGPALVALVESAAKEA